LKRQPKNQIFPERYNILQIVFFASFLQPSDFTLNTQVTLKKGFKKSVTIFESHHSRNNGNVGNGDDESRNYIFGERR